MFADEITARSSISEMYDVDCVAIPLVKHSLPVKTTTTAKKKTIQNKNKKKKQRRMKKTTTTKKQRMKQKATITTKKQRKNTEQNKKQNKQTKNQQQPSSIFRWIFPTIQQIGPIAAKRSYNFWDSLQMKRSKMIQGMAANDLQYIIPMSSIINIGLIKSIPYNINFA